MLFSKESLELERRALMNPRRILHDKDKAALLSLLNTFSIQLEETYNGTNCIGYNQGYCCLDGGYPILYYGGEGFKVARIVCFIHHGLDITDVTIFSLHKCDNTKCINQDHLFVGNHQTNMLDRRNKGRDNNPHAKKTHCPRNHEYSKENTRIYRGRRNCRTCERTYRQRRGIK